HHPFERGDRTIQIHAERAIRASLRGGSGGLGVNGMDGVSGIPCVARISACTGIAELYSEPSECVERDHESLESTAIRLPRATLIGSDDLLFAHQQAVWPAGPVRRCFVSAQSG